MINSRITRVGSIEYVDFRLMDAFVYYMYVIAMLSRSVYSSSTRDYKVIAIGSENVNNTVYIPSVYY